MDTLGQKKNGFTGNISKIKEATGNTEKNIAKINEEVKLTDEILERVKTIGRKLQKAISSASVQSYKNQENLHEIVEEIEENH